MQRLIKFAFLFLALVSVSWAAIADDILLGGFFGASGLNGFYWSATGNDSANCLSPATACQTIAHFNAFSFSNNATVHFHGGDTFTGSLTNIVGGMTITSYGTGQPTISSGNSGSCVTVTNLAGVTVNNLNCVGGGNGTNTKNGIYFTNNLGGNSLLVNATITNNTVTGYGKMGILVSGSAVTPSGFSNVVVNNNTVHDSTGNDPNLNNFTTCIAVGTETLSASDRTSNSNVTIKNNTVYNCNGTANNNVGSGSGILVNGTTTGLIASNVIHDYGANNTNCGGPAGIIIQDADTITAQFNEVYNGNMGTGGACDGEALDIDNLTVNSVMQYNYVHDMKTTTADILLCGCAATGGLTWNNNTFRFNIVVNTVGGHPGLVVTAGHSGLFQPITNAFVYNNTFYNAASPTIITGLAGGAAAANPTGTDWTGNVANNIFYAVSTATISISLTPSVGFAGNVYYNTITPNFFWNGATYNTLASFQNTTGQEKISGSPVGLTSNPNFLNAGGVSTVGGYSPPLPVGYHLQAGSPALPNAGLNLTTNFSINPGTQDFYGKAVTAATLPVGAGATTFTGGTSSVSLVQHGGGGNCAGSCSFNTGAAMTGTAAGNLLVVGIFWCGDTNCATSPGQTITSVTTSQGDTCVQAPKAGVSTNPVDSDLWYCQNIVGGTEQVTCTSSSNVFFMGCPITELHGVSATRPIDSVGKSFIGTQTAQSYSVSTGDATLNSGEFVYSIGFIQSNPATTMGQIALNNGFDEYQISGPAGAVYFNTATWSGGERYSVSLGAFE